MACYTDYISINNSYTSRSGLYASDLPGIDVYLLDGIAKNIAITPDEDHDDIWATVYKRAWNNMVSDASKNIQNKFFVDLKLITRETSEFKATDNTSSGLAGVTIDFTLPKYAKLHIVSVGVYSETSYSSGQVIKIYDTDQNGELLTTITKAVVSGRNTFNVDTDYEVDKVFVSYNPSTYLFRSTENKYYRTYGYFDGTVCNECFYGDPEFIGEVVQVNGGGLNVKFIVYCAIDKFVCENIKLFEQALLYKIGYEITVERRLGERLNQYTIMTKERWDELESFYKAQYEENLMNVINASNIPEDKICFACKNTVRVEPLLP